VWALNIPPPCLLVATVAATPRLLGDEEAHIVARVVRRLEAPRTKNAAIVQRTISNGSISSCIVES